jgi:hypothetical protein
VQNRANLSTDFSEKDSRFSPQVIKKAVGLARKWSKKR